MKRIMAPLLAATAAWSGLAVAEDSLSSQYVYIEMPWLQPAGTISTTDDMVGLDRALGMDQDAGLGLGFSISPSWMHGFDLRASYTRFSFDRRIDSFNDYTLLGVDVSSSGSSVTSSWGVEQLEIFAVAPFEGLHFNTRFEVGAGAQMVDSKFTIREDGSQAMSQSGASRVLDYRPYLHFGVDKPLVEGVAIKFKAGGFPVRGDSTFDASLWLELDDPDSEFYLRSVYRYLNYEYDNESNVSYDVQASGFTVGVGYDLGGVAWPSRADQDADGVLDHSDRCPDSTTGAVVDAFGCEADQDRDGVANEVDTCPNTPEGVSVDDMGCVLDADADGVPDGQDQCPETPAGEPVESNGCSFDEDGDGVTDALDECPATPPGVVVDADGCGGDADGDGVADGVDQCPDTVGGVPVNAEGCAIQAAPIADCGVGGLECAGAGEAIVLPSVKFATAKAVLTANAKSSLDDVATAMQRQPDLVIEVQGHTDSVGDADDNQLLSEFRAQAVVDYLISVGVSAGRLSAKGLGDAQPVASNDNPTGRALNRRVVLVVTDA